MTDIPYFQCPNLTNLYLLAFPHPEADYTPLPHFLSQFHVSGTSLRSDLLIFRIIAAHERPVNPQAVK